DLGIGKGYRHSEFKGFNVAPEEAEARFDESVDVLLRSWQSRERFSHHGRFWRFEDVVVEPPPAQLPHPPLWTAAAGDDWMRKAAGRGFNLLPAQAGSPEQAGERLAAYRRELAAHGRAVDATQVAVARQVYVAKDRADADAGRVRLAKYTQRTV